MTFLPRFYCYHSSFSICKCTTRHNSSSVIHLGVPCHWRWPGKTCHFLCQNRSDYYFKRTWHAKGLQPCQKWIPFQTLICGSHLLSYEACQMLLQQELDIWRINNVFFVSLFLFNTNHRWGSIYKSTFMYFIKKRYYSKFLLLLHIMLPYVFFTLLSIPSFCDWPTLANMGAVQVTHPHHMH